MEIFAVRQIVVLNIADLQTAVFMTHVMPRAIHLFTSQMLGSNRSQWKGRRFNYQINVQNRGWTRSGSQTVLHKKLHALLLLTMETLALRSDLFSSISCLHFSLYVSTSTVNTRFSCSKDDILFFSSGMLSSALISLSLKAGPSHDWLGDLAIFLSLSYASWTPREMILTNIYIIYNLC